MKNSARCGILSEEEWNVEGRLSVLCAHMKNISGKKVLVVEDDFFVSDIYHTKFEQEGCDVIIARDGEDALQKLDAGLHPDIILLDIVMPKMDGKEFLRKVKSMNGLKDIPVLILSNLSQQEDVDDGLGMGADEYVIKSHFTPSEVFEKTVALLDRRERDVS